MTNNISQTTIKRLTLATDNASRHQEVALFASVTTLHDAIEIFLLAAAEHLNAKIGRRTEFEQYLDKIDEKLTPHELPNRPRLLQFNKMRTSAKHDGIRPDKEEVLSFLAMALDFFEATTKLIFEVNFWTISLIDFIDDDEKKTILEKAREYFENGRYLNCLVECRKAFFLTFEINYDIQKFKEDDTNGDPLLSALKGWSNKSPYFTRNKDYINQNVREPLDYIQLDHNRVDSDLVKEGIDPTIFWNIWRLTPPVYRHKPSEPWAIKFESAKNDDEGLQERAAYVLESVISILVRIESRQRSLKWAHSDNKWIINLKSGPINLYKRADKNGDIEMVIPENIRELSVGHWTTGLYNDGDYWHVSHHIENGPYLAGYIYEHDAED